MLQLIEKKRKFENELKRENVDNESKEKSMTRTIPKVKELKTCEQGIKLKH